MAVLFIYALQHGYFEALRAELGNTNINVVIVCPGPVTSEIFEHRVADPSLPKQEDGKRMDTARCTALIAKAMYHNIPEAWISEQPYLTTAYLATYFPSISRMVRTHVSMGICTF
jgi:dehydrogenase/reductase SDR family protein 7